MLIRVVVRVREMVMINTIQNLRNPNPQHQTAEKGHYPEQSYIKLRGPKGLYKGH